MASVTRNRGRSRNHRRNRTETAVNAQLTYQEIVGLGNEPAKRADESAHRLRISDHLYLLVSTISPASSVAHMLAGLLEGASEIDASTRQGVIEAAERHEALAAMLRASVAEKAPVHLLKAVG
jgi:hypothetical protein